MALTCGIVGLPNVGKSTLFTVLTKVAVDASNYPFCTIDPNIGRVAVPDLRLDVLAQLYKPKKTIPATVEYLDIAGLVKGASKGEGLGNQFLANIRETSLIIHMVRCFDDDNVTHVHGAVDPILDIETIHYELALADLETVRRRKERLIKDKKHSSTALRLQAKTSERILERLEAHLNQGGQARSLLHTQDPSLSDWSDEDHTCAQELMRDMHLLTAKPLIYVCNVDESTLTTTATATANTENPSSLRARSVTERAIREHTRAVYVSSKFEAELAQLPIDEQEEFLQDSGIRMRGLDLLIRESYTQLGLQTFFTAGPQEVHAWTYTRGTTAPKAAGIIHSDFEKGFIKAEVFDYEAIRNLGNEAEVRAAGKLRIEGKEYVVQDGDIMFFKFNV